jgi:predicted transcriptional regulator
MSDISYNALRELVNLEKLSTDFIKELYDEGIIIKVTTESGKFEYMFTDYGKKLLIMALG